MIMTTLYLTGKKTTDITKPMVFTPMIVFQSLVQAENGQVVISGGDGRRVKESKHKRVGSNKKFDHRA
jgi:hypothetical protein